MSIEFFYNEKCISTVKCVDKIIIDKAGSIKIFRTEDDHPLDSWSSLDGEVNTIVIDREVKKGKMNSITVCIFKDRKGVARWKYVDKAILKDDGSLHIFEKQGREMKGYTVKKYEHFDTVVFIKTSDVSQSNKGV